jgi:hypothetical protein
MKFQLLTWGAFTLGVMFKKLGFETPHNELYLDLCLGEAGITHTHTHTHTMNSIYGLKIKPKLGDLVSQTRRSSFLNGEC